jgi:hypothetical protein
MSFRTYQELIDNVKNNPQLAKQRILKAVKEGREPVSPRNPGYKPPQGNNVVRDAARRRLEKGITPKKINNNPGRDLNSAVKSKLSKIQATPSVSGSTSDSIDTPEDKLTAQRKKVGY